MMAAMLERIPMWMLAGSLLGLALLALRRFVYSSAGGGENTPPESGV